MEINKNKENIDKKSHEESNQNNNEINNKETKPKISKSKKKRLMKKEKYMSIKKMEYINRQNILNSLEQHNKNNAKLASELISIKTLGQKRKREKQKNKEKDSIEDNNNDNNKNQQKEIENNNESISSSSSSSDNEEEENNNININNKNKVSQKQESKSLINGLTPNEFLNKLLEEKLLQRQLEEMSEIKQYLLGDNQLYIPSQKSSTIINRSQEIIDQRSKLPIISQEHDIMYSINNSLVTIICGETGSGKSTQIPQFLYERGYTKELGKIAITQPRRVAARSLAFRLREEMNMKNSLKIGYQVRYENDNVSKETEIKFVTDGILLKELEEDSLLSQYSVIIIDEAHERTINSDLLIGFISQILKIRYLMWKKNIKYNKYNKEEKNVFPLRLIIMSATLRVSEFSENEIFNGILKPRVVEINSRQYPAHIYHSKKTENDYINEAFKYCCKIHSRLPEGNVIVFLTGKKEILDLCKKLKDEFNGINIKEEEENNYELNKDNNNIKNEDNNNNIKNNDNNNEKKEEKKEEEKILEEIDENTKNILDSNKKNYPPVIVLPLYSSMEPEEQMKIYQEHKGKRMIVISTNVAETSLTIPKVRYIVDSGRVKKRIYKSGLSFSTFKIEWISQASSNQRSGRAGRTCEGYCYRLYSNGLYVKMEKFNEPQISTSSLSQVILTMKSMKVTLPI